MVLTVIFLPAVAAYSSGSWIICSDQYRLPDDGTDRRSPRCGYRLGWILCLRATLGRCRGQPRGVSRERHRDWSHKCSSPVRLGSRVPFGTGLCAFVIHAEELDHGFRVTGTIHSPAYPTRVGQGRMHRSPSFRYQLVTYFLGKGQVSEARAVQMPELHLAVAEPKSASTGVAGADPGPARNLALDRPQRFVVHKIPP